MGNISASELVEIKSTGSVAGNIKCVRLSIDDGAQFRGRVDMERGSDIAEKFDPNKAAPGQNPSAAGWPVATKNLRRIQSFQGLLFKLRVDPEQPPRAS